MKDEINGATESGSLSLSEMKSYLKDKKAEKLFGGRMWIVKQKEDVDRELKRLQK